MQWVRGEKEVCKACLCVVNVRAVLWDSVVCPGAGDLGVWLWCCGTLCDVSWCPGDMAVLWDAMCVLSWCRCPGGIAVVLWDTCVMCPGAQGIWLCCGTLCVFCPGAGVQRVLLWCCGTLYVMCPGAGVHGVWLWCCGTLCDLSWCPGNMAVLWDTVGDLSWCRCLEGSGVVGHCVMCPGAGVQGVWLCCGTLCVICPGAGVQGVGPTGMG